MPLVQESVVRPADQISDSHIEHIYNTTREALYASHVRSMGTDGNYLIRVDTTVGGQNVSQIRISTGQGVRAVWDLFPIIGSAPDISGSTRCRTMYAMAPIIISRNLNVKIEYFIRPSNPTITRGVEIAILGLTCESSGAYIQP